MVIGTAVVVVAINVIASTILTAIVSFEKCHTINDETMGQFKKLTILQFINIALIILMVNFDFTVATPSNPEGRFLGFLPIFNGQYPDFDSSWYAQVGKTLCLTLVM